MIRRSSTLPNSLLELRSSPGLSNLILNPVLLALEQTAALVVKIKIILILLIMIPCNCRELYCLPGISICILSLIHSLNRQSQRVC